MMDVVKGAGAALVAGALGGTGDVLEAIILLAAGGAALGWLYSRLLKPAAKALGRMYESMATLEDLPAFMEKTNARLDRGAEKMEELQDGQARHGAILSEVAARETAIVRDALRAGEQVDREEL
jgi:hypothetical protein